MGKESWGEKIEGGWFLEDGHVYRNEAGTIVTSPTKVFDILGISNFSMIDPEVVRWKKVYGNAIHASVQYMVVDDLDWGSVDPVIIPAVEGIKQRLEEMKFKLEATEEQRVACISGMSYGMRLDLKGSVEHRGVRRPAVIDIKTGSKPENYWMWQLASYIAPQPKVIPPGWLGVILQVAPTGKVAPHYLVDVPNAIREFQCLLATTILMANHGYAKFGGTT